LSKTTTQLEVRLKESKQEVASMQNEVKKLNKNKDKLEKNKEGLQDKVS
jgi:predicted  nucleic acid-binding Zn-ribbon protein